MSTRSAIGYKYLSGKIDAVWCHYDGSIGHHGVILSKYYATKELAKFLVSHGWIDTIDVYPMPLVKAPSLNELNQMSLWPNGNFTIFGEYTNENRGIPTYHFRSEEDFVKDSDLDAEYHYLFDEKDNEWYVYITYPTVKKYNLKRLVTDDKYLYSYFKDSHSPDYKYESKEEVLASIKYDVQQTKELIKAIMGLEEDYKNPTKIVSKCNRWLHYRKLDDKISFGLSSTKELGDCYAIFDGPEPSEDSPSKRRKAILRSKNINDLTLAVCNQYGLNPYDRTFF